MTYFFQVIGYFITKEKANIYKIDCKMIEKWFYNFLNVLSIFINFIIV